MQFSPEFRDVVFYTMIVITILALCAIAVIGRMNEKLRRETQARRAARLAREKAFDGHWPSNPQSIGASRAGMQIQVLIQRPRVRMLVTSALRCRAAQLLLIELVRQEPGSRKGGPVDSQTAMNGIADRRNLTRRVYRVHARAQWMTARPGRLRR